MVSSFHDVATLPEPAALVWAFASPSYGATVEMLEGFTDLARVEIVDVTKKLRAIMAEQAADEPLSPQVKSRRTRMRLDVYEGPYAQFTRFGRGRPATEQITEDEFMAEAKWRHRFRKLSLPDQWQMLWDALQAVEVSG